MLSEKILTLPNNKKQKKQTTKKQQLDYLNYS